VPYNVHEIIIATLTPGALRCVKSLIAACFLGNRGRGRTQAPLRPTTGDWPGDGGAGALERRAKVHDHDRLEQRLDALSPLWRAILPAMSE
jgi:hypothetical protein